MDKEKIIAIQGILGVQADGIFGPVSQAALSSLLTETGPHNPVLHEVKASSFADPDDIARYRKAKARGLSDQDAFKVGDNGIGCWGDDCTAGAPMCALPPEDWHQLGRAARGAKVRVRANGKEIVCELRDTMPKLRHITNGAGIDLNPAAVKAIGLTPPIMHPATWEFVA